MVTLFTEHVILPETAAVGEGIELSVGTFTVAVETQPVTLSVTVRVKSPHVLTVGFCTEELKPEGPDQAKLTLVSVLAPVNVAI